LIATAPRPPALRPEQAARGSSDGSAAFGATGSAVAADPPVAAAFFL